MSRLTKKVKDNVYIVGDNLIEGYSLCGQPINKLGQYEDIDEDTEHLEKVYKALEIIKEKFVNITILMGCESLEEYNKHPLTMRKGRLTQEEYDLLKEVLV